MALTRPKIWDIDTNIQYFMDPITVLHQGATSANVDVGFLFNRANGLVSNVAVYWSESSQSMQYVFTSNTGVTNSNISPTGYANVTVGNVLFVNGAGLYVNGSLGAAGSVLGSNGTSLSWVTGGGFNGGTITSPLTVSQTDTGNQYILTMKGNTTGDQWAFTVGSTAGQNNITSLNTAGSAYAPFTVNGSTFTIGTTGASATTSLSIDNTGATRAYGNLTYGSVPILDSSSTTTGIGASPVAIDTFATTTYRGAKYIISTSDITNRQYQIAEVILTQDSTNVGISVYGVSYTGTTARMTFSSNIVAGNATLWGTGISANNTVNLTRTLIPV